MVKPNVWIANMLLSTPNYRLTHFADPVINRQIRFSHDRLSPRTVWEMSKISANRR